MPELDIKWYIEKFRGIIPEKHGAPDPVYVDYIDKIYELLAREDTAAPPVLEDSLIVENGVIVELEPGLWDTLVQGVKKKGRKQTPEIIVVLPPGTNNIDLSKPLTVVFHQEQKPVEGHIKEPE
jgi:hypothetical protein